MHEAYTVLLVLKSDWCLPITFENFDIVLIKTEIDRSLLNRSMFCFESLPLSRHYQALIHNIAVVSPLS